MRTLSHPRTTYFMKLLLLLQVAVLLLVLVRYDDDDNTKTIGRGLHALRQPSSIFVSTLRRHSSPFTSITTTTTTTMKIPSRLMVVTTRQQQQQQQQQQQEQEPLHIVLNDVEEDELVIAPVEINENDNRWTVPSTTTTSHTNNSTNMDVEVLVGCIALITGTTIGAGILALPTVTYTSGFVTSTVAMLYGYIVMTLSGLYIAELTIRIAHQSATAAVVVVPSSSSSSSSAMTETPSTSTPSKTTSSLGLLDLYNQGMLMQPLMDTSCYGQQSQTSITTTTTTTSTQRLVQYGSTMAYFFLHYAMMVAYIAQGGTNTMSILFSNDPMMGPAMIGPIAFTTIMAISIYTIPKRIMSLINNILVVGVFVSMGSIVAAGVPTIDPNTLIHIQPSYQNPINVLSSLPIIFLAFVYHNIVPFIVKELQYNVTAIQMAIVIGTSLPFLMFVTWNAIVLGNIDPVTIQSMGGNFDPISVLTMNTNTGTASWLGFSISTFSTLAVITSLIGFTYGLNEAWNDLFNMAGSTNNDTTNQSLVVNDPIDNPSSTSTDVTSSASTQKLLIYTLIFVPPLLIALNNPNIFVPALDYGGTFGVTILFLILPTYILWNLRYSNIEIPTDTSNHMMTPSGRGDEIMLNSKISETTTTTTTIVPGGKIPMIGLWLTAVGLMIDQIMEKFDVHFILPTFSGM